MKRLLPALALCGCALSPVKPSVPAPDWVQSETVWVDPHPGSTFGWGSDMEGAAQVLQQTLMGAGMQLGTEHDADALQVKLDVAAGLVDFTFSYKLLRAGRLVEEGSFVGNDQPCWAALSTKTSKMECVIRVYADRILGSRVLALEHQGAVPAVASAQKIHISGRLAVLDLRLLTRDLNADNGRYFTDLVRAATLKFAPQMEVMTRENLIVLLQSTGRDIANCEGECEVDTGRRIGADAIISGELQKVGSRYKMTLRLHETHEGRLVAAAVASGKTIDLLDDDANKATAALFGATH